MVTVLVGIALIAAFFVWGGILAVSEDEDRARRHGQMSRRFSWWMQLLGHPTWFRWWLR